MKATDVRIGNYYDFGGHGQIERFTAKDIMEFELDPIDDIYHPITLTEEWLLKFGFTVPEGYPLAWGKGRLRVNVGNQKTWLYGDEPIRDIKYVHSLQNLYYALTGEELTIKE